MSQMNMSSIMRGNAVLLCIFMVVKLSAEQVVLNEALKKAQAFMPGKKFELAATATSRANQVRVPQPFYAFNVEEDGGFVLVSGDDRTIPILGYSNSGSIKMEDLPDNLHFWLDSYEQQIKSIDDGGQPVTWSTSMDMRRIIKPLLQTKWNQTEPYNSHCPVDKNSGETCVTGCVATALAQVLYYYKWPEKGRLLLPYRTSGTDILVPYLKATEFRWDLMKLEYAYNDTTSEAADAVAALMRYCGQAMKMDYGTDMSGASLDVNVLKEVFDYSSDLRKIYRSQYTDADEWDDAVYQELSEGSPVLYDGYPTEGDGHQFVCDGYDGKGYFHINWGWGGYSDGYFLLSVCNPYENGQEGFANGQTAVVGMQPNVAVSDYDVMSLNFPEDVFVNEETTLSLSLKNKGTTARERINFWVKQGDTWELTASAVSTVGAGQDGEAVFTFTPTVAGMYEVKITADMEGTVVKASAIIQIVKPEQITSGDFVFKCNPTTRHAVLTGLNNYSSHPVVIIPESFIAKDTEYRITCIGKEALTSRIWKVELPATLTQIDKDAFLRCSSLLAVVSHGQDPFVWDGYKESSSATLFVPEGTKTKYEACKGWDSFARIVEGVPLETMNDGVYYLCDTEDMTAKVVRDESHMALTTVNIPSAIHVDGTAFMVTEVGKYAFRSCSRISTLTLPPSLKVINDYAFYGCQDLREFVIPEACTTIGVCSFMALYNLKSLELPSKLTSIGSGAFRNTRSLETVVSHIQVPFIIPDGVFTYYQAPSSATLYVPSGTKADYLDKGWNQFANIEESDELRVSGVSREEATERGKYFNLKGQRVNKYVKGLIIKERGGLPATGAKIFLQ